MPEYSAQQSFRAKQASGMPPASKTTKSNKNYKSNSQFIEYGNVEDRSYGAPSNNNGMGSAMPFNPALDERKMGGQDGMQAGIDPVALLEGNLLPVQQLKALA